MRRKHIAILLLLVIVVGGGWLILQKRNQNQWSESAAPDTGKILDFPVNDVARVDIRGTTGEVHLQKKNGIWVVTERDYPADFQRVSTLIRQLWELRPVQQIKVGPSQFGRLGLTAPGHAASAQPPPPSHSDAGAVGTELELKNENDKTLAKLIVGNRVLAKEIDLETLERLSSIPTGRYVFAPGNGEKVSVINQRLEVDPQPKSWLKHDFIKIENPESISLTAQTGPKRWTLTRSDAKADWKLVDSKPNEQINKAIVGSLSSLLASLRFTDVLPPNAKPEDHGLDNPDVLRIQTFDGFNYTLKIGKRSDTNYPMSVSVTADLAKERTPAPGEKPEDKAKLEAQFKDRLKQLQEKAASEKEFENRIYLVPKFSLDPILKDRADLLAKPSPSPTPSPTPKTGSVSKAPEHRRAPKR